MTEKLKQIIEEEVTKLPKDAQDAINSLDWVKITEEIGKKYFLGENGINNLQIETLLILVGLEDGNYYAQNIENKVKTGKEEAGEIADEALEKIFTPINDILIEKVKNNPKNKNLSAEKNLNFILSGGDYSTLIEERRNQTPETSTASSSTPTLKEIKDNLVI